MLSKELNTNMQTKSHFSNLYLKLSNIFILKMRFLKNSALESFIIVSVIAASLLSWENKMPFLCQLNIAAEQNKAILNKMIKSFPH